LEGGLQKATVEKRRKKITEEGSVGKNVWGRAGGKWRQKKSILQGDQVPSIG